MKKHLLRRRNEQSIFWDTSNVSSVNQKWEDPSRRKYYTKTPKTGVEYRRFSTQTENKRKMNLQIGSTIYNCFNTDGKINESRKLIHEERPNNAAGQHIETSESVQAAEIRHLAPRRPTNWPSHCGMFGHSRITADRVSSNDDDDEKQTSHPE